MFTRLDGEAEGALRWQQLEQTRGGPGCSGTLGVSGPVNQVVQVRGGDSSPSRGRARGGFWGQEGTTCMSPGPGISLGRVGQEEGRSACPSECALACPAPTELWAVWLRVSPTAENTRAQNLLFWWGELRALGRKCGVGGRCALEQTQGQPLGRQVAATCWTMAVRRV